MNLHHLDLKERLSFVNSSLVFSDSVSLPVTGKEGGGGGGENGPPPQRLLLISTRRPRVPTAAPRTGSSVSELEAAQTQLGPACAVSVLLSEREHSFELASKGLAVSCPTPHTLGIALSENSKLCEGRCFKEGSFKEGAPYKRKSRGC